MRPSFIMRHHSMACTQVCTRHNGNQMKSSCSASTMNESQSRACFEGNIPLGFAQSVTNGSHIAERVNIKLKPQQHLPNQLPFHLH